MLNPAAGAQVLHMLLAAYASVGFGVAGIHARMLLSKKSRSAFQPPRAIRRPAGRRSGCPRAAVRGRLRAVVVARTQPVKLAAMEGQFETERRAPLRIGGLPDQAAGIPDTRSRSRAA